MSFLDIYTQQIGVFRESMDRVISEMIPLMDCSGTVYLTGIGKSGLICQKSVATWQSLGIQAHTLHLQDLFHGNLGILRPQDRIVYISNSGNTEEILPIARYIRDRLGILQYAITNNAEGSIASCVDRVFALGPDTIHEADCLNRAPSVSSVLFMIVLDLIGIQLAEKRGITKEQFLLFHPGGTLGKK